jgi:hemerythrin-like domain-containing protein
MRTVLSGAQQVHAFEEHEHRELVTGIARIHEAACDVGRRARSDLSLELLDVLDWARHTLEPHLAWEDGWLYPEIDRRIGTPWATRAARYDHAQIRTVTSRLEADEQALLRHEDADRDGRLRCHLFSLEALLTAHIEREDRFLLPLLDTDQAMR